MRIRTIVIGTLLWLCAASLAVAQSGQDLYQQGLGKEQLGDYEGAIKIYERIVRDFPRDRPVVARAKVHLGDCWIKLGEAKGLDFLSDVINNYKDQAESVAEAKRVASRSSTASRSTRWMERDFLLVAEFKNGTGDPTFDNSLSAALSFQLFVSPYLDVFPYSRVGETLIRMRRPQNERLTHAVAQEICDKAGVKGILLPSIDGTDTRYNITLEVVNCGGGERIAHTQVEAPSREQVVSQLGKATVTLRAAMGESADSIRQFEPREITTNSFEALETYARGYRQRVSGAFGSANETLKQAVRLDPRFAAAHVLLAALNVNNDESRSSATAAYALRDQVSDRERLYIEAQYQTTVLGNVDKTIATLERLRDLYPRDGDVRTFLGDQYRLKGMFENGLREHQMAIRLNPWSATARDSLMRTYMELGRFPEAQAVFNEASEQGVATTIGIHVAMYSMAAAHGDTAVMEAEVNHLKNRTATGIAQALISQANVAALAGDIASVRRFREEVLSGAAIPGIKAFTITAEARAEALFGEVGRVGPLVEQSFRISRSPARLTSALISYGLAGDMEKLKPLIEEIRAKYPEDTFMNTIWIPTALAAVESRQGNGAGAIQLLQPAVAHEPSANSFWPIYVRGLAYIQTGSGRAAAIEFQKILDHQGVDPLSPLNSLVHFRLAEAHALMGNLAQSRKSYETFFMLWKDADPTIPVLKEARAKYSALPGN